jgi:abortive infection bacteriophage resistance protein
MSVTKTTFAKKAQTPVDLLAKLKLANLTVLSDQDAIKYLTYVGHFRLKGYWFHLTDPTTKLFKPNVTFDVIKNRYEFDRKVRALVLEAVERLEIAVRSELCNHLSIQYSPHWYLMPSIFKPVKDFGIGSMLSKIEHEVGRSHEKRFIEHFYNKHDNPYLPPSWAMAECITMGLWSRVYQIIKNPVDKKSVAIRLGVDTTEVFESWLHTLTVVRNMAAHHDRFLANKLRVGPANYKKSKLKFTDNKSIYSALTIMHFMLRAIGFGVAFKANVIALQNVHGAGMMQELGFPNNWPIGAIGW